MSPISWKQKAEIIPGTLTDPPRLRFWLRVPDGIQLISADSPKSKTPPVSGDHIPGAPWSGPVLEFLPEDVESSINLVLQNAAGKKIEWTLVLTNDWAQTDYLNDPSCADAGIRFYLEPGHPSKSWFTSAQCKVTNGVAHVRVDTIGRDALKAGPGLHDLNSSQSVLELEVPAAGRPDDPPRRLGTIQAGYAETAIYFVPKPPNRRFHLTFGLGGTYIWYSEPANGVQLSEIGLTAKVAASFRLSQRFDTSASAFGTLVPIVLAPSGLPGARFWGLNGRVGYAFPKPTSFVLSVSLGYYLMGLATSGPYGFSLATGPQVFVVASAPPGAKREMSAYFKFSTLANGFTVSPANHEIAVGGAFQFARIGKVPMAATLDVSQMAFTATDGINKFESATVSLGVQVKY